MDRQKPLRCTAEQEDQLHSGGNRTGRHSHPQPFVSHQVQKQRHGVGDGRRQVPVQTAGKQLFRINNKGHDKIHQELDPPHCDGPRRYFLLRLRKHTLSGRHLLFCEQGGINNTTVSHIPHALSYLLQGEHKRHAPVSLASDTACLSGLQLHGHIVPAHILSAQ